MKIASPPQNRPDLIAHWLWMCAALVLLMVVVGGITRLTESGLSITDWKLVTGAIPPLTPAAWQEAFAQYQASPQYRLMNAGMSLSAFKQIYFWEFSHRLLGRLIGFAFALPLIWFVVKRQVPQCLIGRLVVLFLLGGLQGRVGWLMVASGLVDNRTTVQPLMLAAHLLAALALLSALVWTALDCHALARQSDAPLARPTRFGLITLALLSLQIFYGALTAGLRAGAVSNTWPLMNEHIIPQGINWTVNVGESWIVHVGNRLVNDPFLVHFIHRWWAWAAFLALVLMARRVKGLGDRAPSIAIHSTVGLQILLGIATVMSGVWLPLAALHQLNGALTLCATVWGAYVLGLKTVEVS